MPRFCVDYCVLDQKMKADRILLPKIQEMFDELAEGEHQATLNLLSCHWKVKSDGQRKEKESFIFRKRNFPFLFQAGWAEESTINISKDDERTDEPS